MFINQKHIKDLTKSLFLNEINCRSFSLKSLNNRGVFIRFIIDIRLGSKNPSDYG